MKKINTLKYLFGNDTKKGGQIIPLFILIINLFAFVNISSGQSESLYLDNIFSPPCSPPSCTISGSTTICPGSSTLLCAPVGNASYSWSTGATGQCISVTIPGTYIVTVGSSGGCTSTCNVTIGTVTCSISGNTSICNGGSTQLCGLAGGSSYVWSTGDTTRCITVTAAGTYTLTQCINGCYMTCSKTVTVSSLNCSITGSSSMCYGGSTSLCAPSGLSSYVWSTGATTRCITVTSAGTYTVTISNGSCTSTCSKTVTVNPPLNCTITGVSSICQGGSTQLCLPSGYPAYSWNTGATTQCITVTSAATYYGNVNNGTCNSTCHQAVTVIPVNCTITGNSTICPGGSTQLCAPAGLTSYLWSTGASSRCITVSSAGTYSVTVSNGTCTSTCSKTVTVGSLPCSITGNNSICAGGSTQLCAPAGLSSYLWSNGSTAQCITVNSGGTYGVTISNGSCTSSCNTLVTVNNPPSCNITGGTSICNGGSTQLCAPAGLSSYSWSTGSTAQCITVSSAGTYTVTISNSSGCTSTCNKTVTVSNNLNCSITGNTSICSGGSTQLCAPAGLSSYLWSNGSTAQCITVNSAGTYSVTVSNGSCTSSCNTVVTVGNPPSCYITGNTSICNGGSTQLCAPANLSSYSWSTGATTRCITVHAAGTYSVTISSGSCTSSCNSTVTSNTPPNCTITGNGTICNGGSTQLCAPAGLSSYAWSTGESTQCITVSSSGTYTVTVSNAGGCTSTCDKVVTVGNTLNCTITGNNFVCAGSTTQLCAPAGLSSYVWSTGATTQCITVNSSANYSVLVSDGGGCTSSCNKYIIVNPPPSCSISGNTTLCPGGSTQLCAPAGLSSYSWSTGATTQCINVNSATTYGVLVTDGNGCTSNCSQIVTNTQPGTCNITGNNDICQGGNTVFSASSGASYLWSTGATSQSITVSNPATYSVTVTNANGCTSYCSRTLTDHNCGITLKKTPDLCEFPYGTPTTVNFTYVIKNTGNFFNTSGMLSDDNGTPGYTSDDVNVCNWGPIPPGDSAICNHSFTISSTHTNVATASGTSGGSTVQATATATVTGISCTCALSYPDNSNLPRSSAVFNESDVLVASDPGPTMCGSTGSTIKLWYNDEHAMLLGIRAVTVKTPGGNTTTNYNITPSPSTAGCFSNPLVGDTISTGDQAANDDAAGGGRPLWPSIFITDLTVNGAGSRIGDWQQGGVGIPPSRVCGKWKAAVKVVDHTHMPYTTTITTDNDPTQNHWVLGSGSDTPTGGFTGLHDQGYGAEVSWDVSSLGLLPGHTYRLEFMVHDGDQNHSGGDVGESCTTIHIPDVNCVPVTPPPPPPNKVCYKGVSHSYVHASQEWTINTATNQATIRTTFSKNFVDNTYGTNQIGWPGAHGHTFSDLVGSDHLQMALYDANNVLKMEFKLDYITASASAPSGYKSLGVTGGDGGMITGNASDVISCVTSLDENFNMFGYPLTTNSPLTNSSYTPNATYPNWIYDVWYEVTVNLSAFPAGFGRPVITAVHASPSKTGSNTESVMDTICTQDYPRLASNVTHEGSNNLVINVYPNPTNSVAHFNFYRTNGKSHTIVEVYSISGQRIARLFDADAEQDVVYNVDLNTENLSSGTYIYRIISDDDIINGRLILMKE